MEGTIFPYAAKRIKPVMLIFSLVILLRGHNEPGGGFIGGLIAASAYILMALSTSPSEVKIKLWLQPLQIMGAGLLLALLSIAPSWIGAGEFMKGVWVELPLLFGEKLKLGTPLLFDIGVFFTVIGFSLSVIFTLMEEWKWK